MAGGKVTATGLTVNLVPATVYTGQTSQAAVGVVPPEAAVDSPGVVVWANLQGGITLTPNSDGTATVQALSVAGAFNISAGIVSNLVQIIGTGALTVLQGFTGLQLTNSAPQNPVTFSREIPLGGSFTLTPVLIPPGCTAPIDANSWTVVPSKPGNAVSINQTTGVVTVTGNVLGSWQAVVSFTSNGQQISASAFWAAVNVIAAATGIQISVNLPDGITIGPATIQLVQGRAGTLSAAAIPVGQSALDAAPSWTTSNSAIVNFGGPATATGYSVPFNVVGSAGTATITCTGTSSGVQVQATLAITALAVATSILVSVAPNNTPVVGDTVTATAITVPGGSSIIGKPQWSVAPTTGTTSPGEASFVQNADGTATITPTSPGLVTVTASAATPTGTITGTATLTIAVSPKDLGLVLLRPAYSLSTQGVLPPVPMAIITPASVGFVLATTMLFVPVVYPDGVQVDPGSWIASVSVPGFATVTIDPNTGNGVLTPGTSASTTTTAFLSVGFTYNNGRAFSRSFRILPSLNIVALVTPPQIPTRIMTAPALGGRLFGSGAQSAAVPGTLEEAATLANVPIPDVIPVGAIPGSFNVAGPATGLQGQALINFLGTLTQEQRNVYLFWQEVCALNGQAFQGDSLINWILRIYAKSVPFVFP